MTERFFWQSGYQRSGNTWLVFIIANMLSSFSTWAEYGRAIPNWNDVLEKRNQALLGWVRGHLLFSPKLPMMTNMRGAFYIVRHPLDVALSAYSYHMKYGGGVALENLPADYLVETRSEFIDLFIEYGGAPDMNVINGGDWQENVLSWLTALYSGAPISLLRYEDLRESPDRAMEVIWRAFANVGIEWTYDLVRDAVLRANESRMRSLDTQNFMGPAVVGRWRDVVTENQRERARRKFGNLAGFLGYEI